MIYTRNNLKGKLVKVNIERQISSRCALGNLNGTCVLVNNAAPYVGNECLVKFDIMVRDNYLGKVVKAGDPFGNFVTSNVPDNFPKQGLNHDQYILTGLWTKKMKKKNKYPILNGEISKYFYPGDTIWVVYLKDCSTRRKGRVSITSNKDNRKVIRLERSIKELIALNLPYSDRFSRVILSESRSQLERITQEAEEKGLTAIQMKQLIS
jgi:hypothetical protein